MKWRRVRALRGLCIDIENKPGTYGPGDYTHPKVTAIGWGWTDHPHPHAKGRQVGRVLERNDVDGMAAIAEEFVSVWDEADFVIAHNGRRHDRKILDGWLMTLCKPMLAPKRMVDTYLDMPKTAGLSKSLENLGERWACPIKKPHLPEHAWEAAYDGQEWAVALMRRRVMADVAINLWLWRKLLELGYL